MEKGGSQTFLRAWLGIDIANSILLINGGIYFSIWLTQEIGAPDYSYNLAIFSVAALVALLGVTYGRYVDRGNELKAFGFTLATMVTAALALGIASLFEASASYPTILVLLFGVVLFTYQIGQISFNSFLKTTKLSSDIQKYSGYSTVANWIGSILGIFLTLGFVSGYFSFGPTNAAAAFLPSALAFGVLTLIFFLRLRRAYPMSVAVQVRQAAEKQKEMRIRPSQALYLVATFLILDAVFTVQFNLPIYMNVVHGVSPETLAPMFLVILVGAAIGGVLSGKVKSAGLRLRLTISSGGLALALVYLSVSQFNMTAYLIAFLVSGVAVGMLEAGLREGYSTFVSDQRPTTDFSFYSIVGRAATLVGPAMFAILLATLDKPSLAYQFGFAGLALFTLIGFGFAFVALASGSVKAPLGAK